MTYGGNPYSKTVSYEVQFDVTGLSAYLATLATLSPGDAEHPNVLPALTGLTSATDLKTTLQQALRDNPTVYVDLSATQLPDGINMVQAFFKSLHGYDKLPNLVKAPSLPNAVASNSLQGAYSNSQNLVVAPEIHLGVTNMNATFQWCYSLTEAPVIPSSVTNLNGCFDHGSGTSSLKGPSVIQIPGGVTDMFKCFNNCTALGSEYHVDIIIEGTNVTNWDNAFQGITSAHNVTVWVPDTTVKAAIESAAGYGGVNVVVGAGPSGP